MTLPASAVPRTTSVLSLVTPSLELAPVSVLMLVTHGAAGGVVSTVILAAAEVGDRLPARSSALAVKLCAPSLRAALIGRLHLPLPSAVIDPTSTPWS